MKTIKLPDDLYQRASKLAEQGFQTRVNARHTTSGHLALVYISC